MIRETVLVVDTEELVRWALAHGLARAGYRTLVAASGADAVRLYGPEVGLLLADVDLPDTSGDRLARDLRTRTPDLPVILLTANRSGEQDLRAERRAALRIVSKPFDVERVVGLVRETLPIRPGGGPPE